MSDTSEDMREKYMARALELARKGTGYTKFNPVVGCVIVKDGRIISEGYHEKYGEFHAERNALLHCSEDPAGADLYVTLEPCCHQGKTPPCTDIIIEKKIRRVYVGALDNNPKVSGRGIRLLQDAGIEVHTGILKKECEKINEVFFHYMAENRPFVAMKYAMTLDGKIATESLDSKWVSSDVSRQYVQELRKKYMGIMVGIGTVFADNPRLTCRIDLQCSPVRIVCDSHLRIPMDCNLVKTARDVPVVVAFAMGNEGRDGLKKKEQDLLDAGVRLIATTGDEVNLHELMDQLKDTVNGILLEGGASLNAAMLREHLVDRVYTFIAPKLVGGVSAPSPVGGHGVRKMDEAYSLENTEYRTYGDDIMITGRVKYEK